MKNYVRRRGFSSRLFRARDEEKVKNHKLRLKYHNFFLSKDSDENQ